RVAPGCVFMADVHVAQVGLSGRTVSRFRDGDTQPVAGVQQHVTGMIDRTDHLYGERVTGLYVHDRLVEEWDILRGVAVTQQPLKRGQLHGTAVILHPCRWKVSLDRTVEAA